MRLISQIALFVALIWTAFSTQIHAEKTMAVLPPLTLLDKGVPVEQNCKDAKNQLDSLGCLCCLADAAVKLNLYEIASKADGMQQAFDKCLKRFFCTETAFNTMKDRTVAKAGKVDASNQDKLTALYYELANQTLPIKQVVIDPADINDNGKLTEQGVANLLTKVCKNQLISQCPLDKSCVKIKDIMGTAGWVTTQLFIIESTCNNKNATYILKGLPKVSEAMGLEAINFLPFKDIVYPNIKKGFPTLAIPYSYFEYKDKAGTNHYLSFMPAAPGKPFLDYIKDYQKDPSDKNYNDLIKMFELFGKSLALFHKTYAKKDCAQEVYPHLDIHAKNIFYNKDTGLIIFIDNDNLGKWAARSKFPTFIKEFNENFWGGEDPITLNTPVKDIRIVWDTLGRHDFLGASANVLLNDKKFMDGTVKAFLKGYKEGWGDQAACAMAFIKGKNHCVDSLFEEYKVGKGCAF